MGLSDAGRGPLQFATSGRISEAKGRIIISKMEAKGRNTTDRMKRRIGRR